MDKVTEAVIGVDVGGTNTDVVILQTNCQPPLVLYSAKSVTTSDVTSGIKSAIALAVNKRNKDQDLLLQRINIGTTHFVNAVVQRKELSKVAVVRLCGTASRQVPPYSDFPSDLASHINGGTYFVNGGYEVDGREIASIDEKEILEVVSDAKKKGISQFVVCGVYCSIRNDQELFVKSIIKKGFTEASVTLSHKIGQLGLIERENAAILNESLKPLCHKTISGFKTALREMNLHCPLYLTQNDGTVIKEESALEYPVFTFASGPTNSMRGAAFLSGKKEAIVVDIGGTSTDVGMLRKGFPREASTEVKIGNVRTNFRMPDVYSIGLGGGSYVTNFESSGSLVVSVGPRSAGYKLAREAYIFQDNLSSCKVDNLTATDLAVAAGHLTLGKKENVSNLPRQLVEAGIEKMKTMIETAIDNVKLSAEPLPVILVGGGGILLNIDNGLEGASELLFPSHFDVANAVGAALSQISGSVEYVVNLAEDMDDKKIEALAATDSESNDTGTDIEQRKKNIRKQLFENARLVALEKAEKGAIEETVSSGAAKATVVILDKSDTPLAYLPGNATKINCKAIGDIKSTADRGALLQKDFVMVMENNQTNSIDAVSEAKEHVESDENTQRVQSKPHINEHNEWLLSEYDIECIGLGAGILGCGGGGSPHVGQILAKRALREGKIMKVVNPRSFLPDKHPTDDLFVETAYMGAPSVISEKLVNGEVVTALQCMKDLFSVGRYHDGDISYKESIEIQKENGVVFINDYQKIIPESLSSNTKLDGQKEVAGLIPAEIGGLNAMEPLLVGAQLELPVLDCDGMGRAFPELQMFCPLIYGAKPYPATLADNKGRRSVILYAETAKNLEDHFRKVTIEMGCSAGLILTPLTKDDIIHKTVPFSISRAWNLGDKIISARNCKTDPVQAVLEQEGGLKLISGKISDVRRETTGGFNKGYVNIDGIECCAGQQVLIEFQNENLIARKSVAKPAEKWEIVACTPDLITILDDDTCEPITTEMVRYGMRVCVLALPIPDIMKTQEALKVVGPQAFGYSDDVKYVPIAKCNDPVPVAP